MEGKYFYHGTDLISLESIFNNYGIKCRRMIEEEKIKINRTLDTTFGIGYNGFEYISLCKINDYSKDLDSAYDTFIRSKFCVILAGDIPAIKTLDLSSPSIRKEYKDEITEFLVNRDTSLLRFSDMKDEWQIKTFVPFHKIVGIGIPVKYVTTYCNNKELKIINNILEVAYILGLDIVDTCNPKFAFEYEEEKNNNKEVIKIRKIKK